MNFFYWLKWWLAGKPMIKYIGYNCGCGAWVNKDFEIPKYLSCGRWSDTWGLCPACEAPLIFKIS